MSRPRTAALLTAVLASGLLLTGCAGHTDGGLRPERHRVAVDTPALRHLKARAGIAPCRPGRARADLPEVTLPCLGGGPAVDLSKVRGPAVVNLWAQWCGPCRQELPYYQALHRKGRGTLTVLGVDFDDPQPAAALRLARDSGVTYPLAADPDAELRTGLRVRGLPGIVLVHRSGRVSVEYRSVRSYAELRGLVQHELGVRLPA